MRALSSNKNGGVLWRVNRGANEAQCAAYHTKEEGNRVANDEPELPAKHVVFFFCSVYGAINSWHKILHAQQQVAKRSVKKRHFVATLVVPTQSLSLTRVVPLQSTH